MCLLQCHIIPWQAVYSQHTLAGVKLCAVWLALADVSQMSFIYTKCSEFVSYCANGFWFCSPHSWVALLCFVHLYTDGRRVGIYMSHSSSCGECTYVYNLFYHLNLRMKRSYVRVPSPVRCRGLIFIRKSTHSAFIFHQYNNNRVLYIYIQHAV